MTAEEMGTNAGHSLQAWTAVLDSLEIAIDDAIMGDLTGEDLEETALVHRTAALNSWTPPTALSPIPEALVERAFRINERQQDAAAQLTRELQTLRQHRSVLNSVQTVTAPEQRSVYLDVTG